MRNAEWGVRNLTKMRNAEWGMRNLPNAECGIRNAESTKCGMTNAECGMAAEPRAGWQAGPQGKGEAGGVKREAGNGRANCGFEGRTEGRRQATVARAGEKE
jgi:hypothetical protein